MINNGRLKKIKLCITNNCFRTVFIMSVTKNQVVIPVLMLKSGVYKYKNSVTNETKDATNESSGRLYPEIEKSSSETPQVECSIIYEENSPNFYYKIPESTENGEVKYTMLECTNISGADLKVSSKYGWETMNCHMTVECYNPLVAWSTNMSKTTNKIEYVRMQQESCMVKSTFDITVIDKLKHLLHSVKISQRKERRSILDRVKKGEKNLQVPTRMQEGLPTWINYIPAKWYSANVRKVIEYTLVVYTILTLFWAIWQLYKHVDFIQRYLRPVLEFIEFYVAILKGWFRHIDTFIDALTVYWWKYMKPVWVLGITLYTSLAQIFKPLRNVAGIIGGIFGPVVRMFQLLFTSLKPVLNPIMSCFYTIAAIYRKVANSLLSVINFTTSSTVVQVFVEKFRQLGLSRIVHNIIHGGLDPFRAQFVVVRDLLIKSVKQIYYGGRFISSRMYMTFIFWKRERQYQQEEQDNSKSERVKSE